MDAPSRIYRLPEQQAVAIAIPQALALDQEIHAFLGAHFPLEEAGSSKALQSAWHVSVARDGTPPTEALAMKPFRAEAGNAAPELGFADVGQGKFWLCDAQAGTRVRWDLNAKAIAVFYQKPGPALVEAVYTSVRTLVHSLLVQRGARLVHASAVAFAGKALLLLGEKGAGKTTLASAMLEEGAQFLASDRCWLWPSAGGWQVVGWIGTYRLRPQDFGQVFGAPTAARLEEFAEAARDCEANYFAGKLRCPPLTFLQLGKWKPAFQAHLHALVVLEPSASGKRLIRNPSAPHQALQPHFVTRQLPPPLQPTEGADPVWPGFEVENWTFAGRCSPQTMARALCQRMGS